MNKVILIGRLTKDVDFRKGDNDKVSARFNLAVNRRFKNANGDTEADFPSCVAFGKTAEFINNYFKRGSAIAITGRIQTGSYEKDGAKVYTTDVFVDEAEFVESKGNGGSDNAKADTKAPKTPASEEDDDLPF